MYDPDTDYRGRRENSDDPAHQWNWMRDESEAASGDGIVFADESEYIDDEED